jgi:hypothetical protein
MTDGFTVDLGALENAAAGINKTLSELKEQDVDDLDGPAEDYGHDGLADTVKDFCDRWQYGVECLAKDAQEVTSRLSQSVQAYLRTDSSLQGMYDGVLTHSAGADPGVQ